MPTNFAPPVNVSPLIRFGRYAMLVAGISYGIFWQNRYTKKELGLKDFKAREKAARDERLAKEKALRNADPGKSFKKSDLSPTSTIDDPKLSELNQSGVFAGGSGDTVKETNQSNLFNKYIFEAIPKTEPKSKMGNQYEIINAPSETSSPMSIGHDFDNFMFMFGII